MSDTDCMRHFKMLGLGLPAIILEAEGLNMGYVGKAWLEQQHKMQLPWLNGIGWGYIHITTLSFENISILRQTRPASTLLLHHTV